jgi:hypothetical protein
VTTIKTEHLLIRYDKKIANGQFTNESLIVLIDNNKFKWTPGMIDSGNLFGTVRTLDGADGPVELNCTVRIIILFSLLSQLLLSF